MNRKACRVMFAACLGVMPATGTWANDTLATIGAGGLQFQKTDELRMLREDLYLSPREVRVAYVFRNLTDHDVRARVAFPMPDIDVAQMSETPHEFNNSARDGDIFDFRTEMDGREIEAAFEARAYSYKGVDVTALLVEHRVPLVNDGLYYPDDDAIRALIAAGLIDANDDLHHPGWFVRPAYHWVQVFPARRDIRILHRYKPVLGGYALTVKMRADPHNEEFYCPDEAFANAFNNKLATTNDPYPQRRELEYRLVTGGNWAGPIGRFRLELDKANSELVSLCPIPGLSLARRGRNFVAEAADYAPTKDIKVMFVFARCNNPRCD
jgi:hypothetical protein